MQTFHKRSSIIAGFAILLVILVGDAFITRHQLEIQNQTASSVSHTRQILFELSETESLIEAAETGQRGYLYTGDERYLTPYIRAVNEVDPLIDALSAHVAGNPRVRARLPGLRTDVHAKLSELGETIALNRAGKKDEARRLVLGGSGLVYMDEIRETIARMESEVSALAASRDSDYEKSIRLTISCIYLTSLLAVFGLAFLAYYIIRENELRERHAHELRTRAEWFRVTLNSIGDAVIATDRDGVVSFLNPTAELVTGFDLKSAEGKNIPELFSIFNATMQEPMENPVSKVIEKGEKQEITERAVLRRRDGTMIPVDDSAAPILDVDGKVIGVVLVFRDASRERKTEEVLRKTEKLAAAARLSATVAHEINNPLEAVVNLIYIAKSEPGVPPKVVSQLSQVERELDRIAHITRQTLGFYRDSNEPEPVELEPLIESVFRLYSNKLQGKGITVVRELGECPPIRAVEGEIKQIVSNLVSNAVDAVGNAGMIRVSLQCKEESGRTWVELAIEDDGPGVPDGLTEKIFEPFFTTKQDVGTGLGLWVTREIALRHGGAIHHSSREDGHSGAVFAIVFPALREPQSVSASD